MDNINNQDFCEKTQFKRRGFPSTTDAVPVVITDDRHQLIYYPSSQYRSPVPFDNSLPLSEEEVLAALKNLTLTEQAAFQAHENDKANEK